MGMYIINILCTVGPAINSVNNKWDIVCAVLYRYLSHSLAISLEHINDSCPFTRRTYVPWKLDVDEERCWKATETHLHREMKNRPQIHHRHRPLCTLVAYLTCVGRSVRRIQDSVRYSAVYILNVSIVTTMVINSGKKRYRAGGHDSAHRSNGDPNTVYRASHFAPKHQHPALAFSLGTLI